MKPQELRIGNHIYWKDQSKIVETINVVSEKCVGLESDIPSDALSPIEFFEPIPLTEDWLMKFGFKQCNVNVCVYETDGGFRVAKVCNAFFLVGYFGNKSVKIPYIHTLQNLYNALTGEELEIKPEGAK